MAHYERLANGKYAYTTTVQVISPTEFTDKSHPYLSGTVSISSYDSGDWYNGYYIPQIMKSPNGTVSNSICSSGTHIVTKTNPLNATDFTYTSKIIDGNNYYGILCNDEKYIAITFKWQSHGGSTDNEWRVNNTKFEITYIPNGTTSIQTKTITASAPNTSALSSSVTYTNIYIGLGMSVGDVILNIKATPLE